MRARLARGSLGSAIIQATSTAFKLALSIILARTLGTVGYGVYAYAFAIMSLLVVFAEAGVPTLLLREVAAAEGRGAWGPMRGALRRGVQLVGATSITITFLGFIVLTMFADGMTPTTLQTMALMLLVLPAAALAKTNFFGLRGLQKVISAQALEMLLRPLLVIALVSILFFVSPELRTPWVAMAAQLLAVTTILLIAAFKLKRAMPAAASNVPLEFQSKKWLKSALPFTLIGGALVINNQVDIIMLGWLGPPDEVGIYRVAVQGAMLSMLSLSAVSAIVAPTLARYHKQGDKIFMQRVVTGSSRVATTGSLAIVAALIFGGENLLHVVFGHEYVGAYTPLTILLLGQFGKSSLGISGPLLSMTGFEALQAKAIWVAVIGNVIANLILIPLFGMNGAAIATTVTAVVWIGYLSLVSRSRLGISVSPLPFPLNFS